MSISTIVNMGRKFDSAVNATVVERAVEIAQDIWNTFGEDITADDAQSIGDGIGGDTGSRVSEWKKFALAVPFGMIEALKAYPKGELTRANMFGLARAVHKAADYTRVKLTVAEFVKSLKAKKKGSGRGATSGMGFGILKNVDTMLGVNGKPVSKAKTVAFRKALAALCEQHGIKY